MNARIYLDHNASTPLCVESRDAMIAAIEAIHGNPSSVHGEGRAARSLLERGRAAVAALVGGAADEVVFTSGGTEADALGIVGLARAARAGGASPHVAIAAIEHPAALGAARSLAGEGFTVVELPVDADGRIDLDGVARAVAHGAALVSVALANHELGTLQDVAAVAAIARAAGASTFCDAVQAAGKRAIDVAALGVDALAVSGHKIHGPAGIGALWVRRDRDVVHPLFTGHQERGRRPGTENLVGAAGLAAAATVARARLADDAPRVAALTARLEAGLLALGGVRVHGAGAPRIGNTINAAFDGALGEAIVTALDLAGIAASTGAACTSGTVKPSAVLLALGLAPDRAVEAVRFSLGRDSRDADVDAVLAALPDIVARARRHR